jgi:hypothetical protein
MVSLHKRNIHLTNQYAKDDTATGRHTPAQKKKRMIQPQAAIHPLKTKTKQKKDDTATGCHTPAQKKQDGTTTS